MNRYVTILNSPFEEVVDEFVGYCALIREIEEGMTTKPIRERTRRERRYHARRLRVIIHHDAELKVICDKFRRMLETSDDPQGLLRRLVDVRKAAGLRTFCRIDPIRGLLREWGHEI